ncbi:WD40/YVTN/BNR-like repeat-containing protein, partial [Robiginitalea sp.]|uniref:WD40/YVTN/BNR-like repeat-containing protein n=1 Tax=Robiginitalea sp. TaxID=1902411 RepID=UPI003C70ED7C
MKLLKTTLFLIVSCLTGSLTAQAPATTPFEIQKGMELQEKMKKSSIVKNLILHNIGPSIMSGRVVDLDVNPSKPSEFYVAYASGGLWYTQNNGTSFIPVMDRTPTQNLGDIAVHWPSGTIYAGTGENNASRSSYAGIGILKSVDKGKTWSFAGLPDSHHIGRIQIHPDRPEEVVVAVLGHLYSPNEERGIYKTRDGGKTWSKTLYINDYTGIVDLTRAPDNPDILFAAAWERDRKAWNFKGSGPGSGIYKSVDGGDSWELISDKASGFPIGEGVGRIGLSAFDANTVYAILDNQSRRPAKKESEKGSELDKEDLRNISVKAFMALDNTRLDTFLKSNGFPEKYTAEAVKNEVENGSLRTDDLIAYLEDANTLLFDTPVIGAEVYLST